MKKIDIMEHVSILDRIRIHIMQIKPGNFELQIESLDNTKNVVFDKKSLKELNHQILERVRDRSATDPKTASYIQEFCAKMIEALWKNGLVELVDCKELPEDIYGDLRNQYRR